MTIYVERAHTADTLAAIVVESDGVFVLRNEFLVENIHHLKERCALEDILQFVGLEVALLFRTSLTPYFNFNIDVLIHNYAL